jgi:hypothetical protein
MDTVWSREVAIRLYVAHPHMVKASDRALFDVDNKQTVGERLPSGVCGNHRLMRREVLM